MVGFIVFMVAFIIQGWVECAGHADRSAFDLTRHSQATNTKLVAEKTLAAPRTEEVGSCTPLQVK